MRKKEIIDSYEELLKEKDCYIKKLETMNNFHEKMFKLTNKVSLRQETELIRKTREIELLLNDNEFRKYTTRKDFKVIYRAPDTILIYKGQKIVSTAKNEPYDKEKGLMACLIKLAGYERNLINHLLKVEESIPNKKIKEFEQQQFTNKID